jgi:hypothetical protein
MRSKYSKFDPAHNPHSSRNPELAGHEIEAVLAPKDFAVDHKAWSAEDAGVQQPAKAAWVWVAQAADAASLRAMSRGKTQDATPAPF